MVSLKINITVVSWIVKELGCNPPHRQKSPCIFWVPPNWTINGLLLTRSLTDNIDSWLTTFYIKCISAYILCVHDIPNFVSLIFLGSSLSASFSKLSKISKKKSLIYLLGEKTCISRPTQFKLLFKGQLLLIFICILFHFFKYEVFYRNYYTTWVAFYILFLLFALLIYGKISVLLI